MIEALVETAHGIQDVGCLDWEKTSKFDDQD